MPDILRFGIESLDKLIGTSEQSQHPRGPNTGGQNKANFTHRVRYGIDISRQHDRDVTTSVCLIGPDGTGKSVLALHLAAQYLADCILENEEELPKVLYISTDLAHSMADKVWHHFDLRHPLTRRQPFAKCKKLPFPKTASLRLKKTSPTDINKALAKENNSQNEVCFVDLAEATAGDDWGFVHRILSVLHMPEKYHPRHLVLLDAVEGFETLVGDINAFGDKSTRRSRIAQVMRLASTKCHLLFVVEENKQERLPEEFVTDAVIRLRNVEISGYVRRTVEIEKTRGQAHVRGQHPFATRDGKGSTTGDTESQNCDDPEVVVPKTSDDSEVGIRHQSYVQIFPSINHLSRTVMETRGTPRMEAPKGKYAGFGIPYLDTMLVAEDEPNETGEDFRGLPCGSVTALIGDALTEKSQLGRAFLSRAFYPFARALAKKVSDEIKATLLIKGTEAQKDEYKNRVEEVVKGAFDALRSVGCRIDLDGKTSEPYLFYRNEIAKSVLPAVDDFRDVDSFVEKLNDKGNTVSQHLRSKLRPETKEYLRKHVTGREPSERLLSLLIRDLNKLIKGTSLYDETKFENVALSQETKTLNEKLHPTGAELARLNRLLLEDAYVQELAIEKVPGVAVLMTTQDTHSGDLAKEFIQWLNPKSMLSDELKESKEVVACFERVLHGYIKNNTICRRMEIHDLSAPIIAHIFQRNIEAAQSRLFGKRNEEELPEVRSRFQSSWRIRMVIDDFNSFRNIFPDMHNDPLLLPFLLFHLRREGISTLILDTQSAKPDIALSERFESSLREVTDYRLYTWRVLFYGESRIAITAIPPMSPKTRGLIRELRRQWMGSDEEQVDRHLAVDPHFELYAGLERGNAHPVPLEVRLYPGSHSLIKYIEDENILFKEVFTPNAGKGDIIVGFNPPNYEAFREFCYLQRDTRLDHTLVFQVDEFWLTWLTRQSRTRKAGVLLHQWPYLNGVTVDEHGEPDRAADAYYLFQETFDDVESRRPKSGEQPRPAQAGMRERRRRDFYDNDHLGYGFESEQLKEKSEEFRQKDLSYYEEIDRVPFSWDFAFLLCKENLWEEYVNRHRRPGNNKRPTAGGVNAPLESVPKLSHSDILLPSESAVLMESEPGNRDALKKERRKNVIDLWRDIQKAETIRPGVSRQPHSRAGTERTALKKKYKEITWRNFFDACKEVAEYHSSKLSTPVLPFDFNLNDGEAFSCLVMEIWLSEIYDSMRKRDEAIQEKNKGRQKQYKDDHASTFAHVVSQKIWNRAKVNKRVSLFEGLRNDKGKTLSNILESKRDPKKDGIKAGYSLELYKTWLLLTEAIDFTDLVSTPHNFSFEFKSRQSNPHAVAAHHWYQSACDLIEQHHLAENLVAVRLPGHFSVRGDWFLAAAGGSRSSRLAHRAMDLLSSRRANIKRLQLGIGLPVRKLVQQKSDFKDVRTRLMATDNESGRLKNVSYEEFLLISGRTKPHPDADSDDHFYWLWRSSLYGYARCSRVWQKWLNRMALWWQTINARHKSVWTPGFTVYDSINKYTGGPTKDFEQLESWIDFPRMVDILLMELQQVSFGHGNDEDQTDGA